MYACFPYRNLTNKIKLIKQREVPSSAKDADLIRGDDVEAGASASEHNGYVIENHIRLRGERKCGVGATSSCLEKSLTSV
jgi:hypothetical protein